eukprot:c20807_g1_i4 orf=708-1199(+)
MTKYMTRSQIWHIDSDLVKVDGLLDFESLHSSYTRLTYDTSMQLQTAGSLYFWTAHLAGPMWGPFASWCCAWLELLGTIAGVGAQVLFHYKRYTTKGRLAFIYTPSHYSNMLEMSHLKGFCRITSLAKHYTSWHWDSQRWWLFGTPMGLLDYVHLHDSYLGDP